MPAMMRREVDCATAGMAVGVGLPALLFMLAFLLFLPTPSSAKSRSTCRAEGSITLHKSSHARVYRAPGFDQNVYGCLYGNDTRYLLTEANDCDPDLAGPDVIDLAGRYVGYAIHFCSEFGPVTDGVRVLDLMTGEVLVRTSGSPTLDRETGSVPVTDMELKTNGSVAWIVHSIPLDAGDEPPEAEEVRKSDRTIAERPRTTSGLLDAGDRIETASLTRKGSRLSWIDAGVRKTARLR